MEGKRRQIEIECPDELLLALGTTFEEFEKEARFALATKLFELGRLSSGHAARLAGMSRVEFLLGLQRLGAPALDLDEGEMAAEAEFGRGA